MEKAFLVSILVPVYGVEQYIERCARSLFEQTFSSIEYIFVDDCSPDNSIDLLKQVISYYPERKDAIKIIHHDKNRGLAGARNTAIDAATADFVVHVDSDDYIELNCIELLVKKQQETGADIVSSGILCHKGNNTIEWPPSNDKNSYNYSLRLIERVTSVNIWGRLIRRSLYINNCLRVDEKTNMGEDYQIIPRLVWYADKIASIDNCLYHYIYANANSYTDSFTIDKDRQAWKSFLILEEFFRDKGHDCVKALELGKLNLIYGSIISCLTTNNNYYYREVRSLIKGCSSKSIRRLPFAKRIIMKIPNYKLLKLLVDLFMYCKKK